MKSPTGREQGYENKEKTTHNPNPLAISLHSRSFLFIILDQNCIAESIIFEEILKVEDEFLMTYLNRDDVLSNRRESSSECQKYFCEKRVHLLFTVFCTQFKTLRVKRIQLSTYIQTM